MLADHRPVRFRARWVVPRCGEVCPGGEVIVWRGRIVRAGRARSGSTPNGCITVDLGSVALLPALLNVHTHLQFSELNEPLGTAGIPFTDWVRLILGHQQEIREDERAGTDAARTKGLTECQAGGAIWLADVTTEHWSAGSSHPATDPSQWGPVGWEPERGDGSFEIEFRRPQLCWARPPERLELQELLGWKDTRRDLALVQLDRYRQLVRHTGQTILTWGLSPHAPYSTHPQLISRSVEVSAATGCLLAMHVAETQEEREFLQTGQGAFRQLLESLGAWEYRPWRPTQMTDLLRQLAAARRVLLVHGNYFTDEEAEFVVRSRRRMTVVYCPRTHHYFRHPPYPLARRLQQGVRIALGTDSRASNPDLSIWNEWQFAVRQHTTVDPWRLLDCVTLHAAQAVGRSHDLGTLDAGKLAAFWVVPIESVTNQLVDSLVEAVG